MLDPRWPVLKAVFMLLGKNGIAHVMPHGRENLDSGMGRDIDIIVDRNVDIQKLQDVFTKAVGLGGKFLRRND
jgi:hypothetical protein